MSNIIDFDGKKAAPYIRTCLTGFMNDPPDTEYQMGYLAACVDIYKEALTKQDDILKVCEKIVYGRRITP